MWSSVGLNDMGHLRYLPLSNNYLTLASIEVLQPTMTIRLRSMIRDERPSRRSNRASERRAWGGEAPARGEGSPPVKKTPSPEGAAGFGLKSQKENREPGAGGGGGG